MKMKQIAAAVLSAYAWKTGLVLGALAMTVEKLDGVPEAQRALYVEKDGKFHLDVSGIEDTGTLKATLQKERDARAAADKKAKDLATQYEGIDATKVRELMAQFENAEEAELIKKGKEGIDLIVSKRTEKAVKDAQKMIDAAVKKAEQAQGVAKKFMDRVLDNHVRAAAAKAGVHASAVDDAMLRAKSIFSVDDEGNAVQLKDGEVVVGKDGKTPFGIGEWVEGMKESAPHWFPAGSTGGNAGGGKGNAGMRTMTRAAYEATPLEERPVLAKEMKEGKLKVAD